MSDDNPQTLLGKPIVYTDFTSKYYPIIMADLSQYKVKFKSITQALLSGVDNFTVKMTNEEGVIVETEAYVLSKSPEGRAPSMLLIERIKDGNITHTIQSSDKPIEQPDNGRVFNLYFTEQEEQEHD